MDIKFLYNFVFWTYLWTYSVKRVKDILWCLFLWTNRQHPKKKEQTSTSNKGKTTRLKISSFPQTDHIPLTPVVPIGPIPTCNRYQSIKSSQTSLGLAIKQFFRLHYQERKKHVKSAYKLAVKIIDSSTQGETSSAWRDKRIWRKLWKQHVPSKVKLFFFFFG